MFLLVLHKKLKLNPGPIVFYWHIKHTHFLKCAPLLELFACCYMWSNWWSNIINNFKCFCGLWTVFCHYRAKSLMNQMRHDTAIATILSLFAEGIITCIDRTIVTFHLMTHLFVCTTFSIEFLFPILICIPMHIIRWTGICIWDVKEESVAFYVFSFKHHNLCFHSCWNNILNAL